MGEVVNLFGREKKEEKVKETDDFDFAKLMEENKRAAEKLKSDRDRKNQSVKSDYKLTKK